MTGARRSRNAVVAVESPLVYAGIASALSIAGVDCLLPQGDRPSALQWLNNHDAELAIVQVGLDEASRPRTLRRLRQRHPALALAALLVRPTRELLDETRDEELSVMICWQCEVHHVVEAVRSLQAGLAYACPCCCRALAHRRLFHGRPQGKPLSRREQEVLRGMAADRDLAQIADELCISEKTVRTYRRNLMDKLGTRTPTGAVLAGVQRGWLDLTMAETT